MNSLVKQRLNTNYSKAIVELCQLKDAEVYTDESTLALYATDASIYQVMPLAVVVPFNIEALIAIVKVANIYDCPILSRGSATSLAGQTTNRAIVIDFSKYFNKILAIDSISSLAVVQPGVVRDQLNAKCEQFGLHFAPDPATSSRATIGGMIANNSSGTKSIKYGKTIDHVLALKVLLFDGTILHLKNTTEEEYDKISQKQTREGQIFKEFRELIFKNTSEIIASFPKVMRRVMGYPLDEFVTTDDWNMAKIMCGSEGTLGIILEATIKLVPIPKYKAGFTVHFHDRLEAIQAVKAMIPFGPAAIEMLDFNVFELSKKNPITKNYHEKLIVGDPQATLSVEFFCLSQSELDIKIQDFTNHLNTLETAYAFPVLRTFEELAMAWALRKDGLGLIMGDPSGRKPMPFIEDMAIPLEHLADYIAEVLNLCKRLDVDSVLYAHASVGVLHVRPALDLTKQHDVDLMKYIMDEVFILVKKYKGAWSGEHGDGRIRSPKLKEYFGDQVYQCLKDVKQIFDPKGLLNPGIIIDPDPMDTHLRYGPNYQDQKYNFVYKYRKDHSFQSLVHNCSGVGACRNHIGGTMCPSFRATENEADSTRGRANMLRLAMSGQMDFENLTDSRVLDVLDLCLSCKACSTECPSNVNMSKLKSEVLQLKFNNGNVSLRERAILHSSKMSKLFSGPFSKLINFLNSNKLFKSINEKVLGIDKRRQLPTYAQQTLGDWYKHNYKSLNTSKSVALFADTYINFHEVEIGISAIRLLNECGYEVLLAEVGCCQRPRISNGFLLKAKESGEKLAESLKPYFEKKIPVLVCEPSCTSALVEDLPDLIDDEALASQMETGIFQIEDFLAQEIIAGNINGTFISKHVDFLIHGHCHQKSKSGSQALKLIMGNIPNSTLKIANSGCCGMAGSFGYEKEHYEISKKIAEVSLLPELAKSSNAVVVATGISCRHQIKDFDGRDAKHWVELVSFMNLEENNSYI